MAGDETTRARVGRLSDRLVNETTFRPSRAPQFGAPKDGTANVLYAEAGIPVVLMEQRVSKDPQTGRPSTVEDRLAFGQKLIRIMAESVLP
jgi:hypothetical protein